ncbi:MAG: hypothetical protein ACK5E6_04475 [Cyanobacteriota bacterium]
MPIRDHIQLERPHLPPVLPDRPAVAPPIADPTATGGGGSPADRGPCPVCGGSGSLRLADQRYRTCLDCLGTGSAP